MHNMVMNYNGTLKYKISKYCSLNSCNLISLPYRKVIENKRQEAAQASVKIRLFRTVLIFLLIMLHKYKQH